MKLSVAMATYNGQKYIIEQLDSIRQQTRKIDEVVISDDNSKDYTRNLIEDYIKKYQLSWSLISNDGKGVAENFYNAIKHTSGDVIFLCDQDDIWLPEKAERVEAAFNKNRLIQCLSTSFVYIDECGKVIQIIKDENKANNNLILHPINEGVIENIPLELVFQKNISPGMTMAVSRKIIDQYLLLSKGVFIHDWEINCIAAAQKELYFYNTVLTKYRIHKEQTVSIANLRKESRKNTLFRKINRSSYNILQTKVLIDELMCIAVDDTKKFLSDMKSLYEVRNSVVIKHKIHMWFYEVYLYKKNRVHGYLDFRYSAIDLLAAFKI